MSDVVRTKVPTREEWEEFCASFPPLINKVMDMVFEQITRGRYPLEMQGGMVYKNMHAALTFSGKSFLPDTITIHFKQDKEEE